MKRLGSNVHFLPSLGLAKPRTYTCKICQTNRYNRLTIFVYYCLLFPIYIHFCNLKKRNSNSNSIHKQNEKKEIYFETKFIQWNEITAQSKCKIVIFVFKNFHSSPESCYLYHNTKFYDVTLWTINLCAQCKVLIIIVCIH